jgi:hypothetical protein
MPTSLPSPTSATSTAAAWWCTEVKAAASRYEIGYHRELADTPEADLTSQELSDNGIDLEPRESGRSDHRSYWSDGSEARLERIGSDGLLDGWHSAPGPRMQCQCSGGAMRAR